MTGRNLTERWLEPASRDSLFELFDEARSIGLLGPGPVASHVDHALGFVELLADEGLGRVAGGSAPLRIADLGSGAGLPGLVIAMAVPDARVALVEPKRKRTDWLGSAVRRLALVDRVEVVPVGAEILPHRPGERGGYDAVVARSFAPPAIVAECAAALVRPGGVAVVSDSPDEKDRWSGWDRPRLGWAERASRTLSVGRFTVLRAGADGCDPSVPRTWASMRRNPVWGTT